jgi:hemolysin activation/secretion protein
MHKSLSRYVSQAVSATASQSQAGGLLRPIVMAVLLMTGGAAQASAAPVREPASAVSEEQRQLERERALREQQESRPDVSLEAPAADSAASAKLPVAEAPCFTIKHIELVGDSAERFQWALRAADPHDDPASGRCLGSSAINLAMKRVQNAIIARGYVTTRVLAAPQDLNSGTLQLSLVPGRIHAIRFADGASSRATLWNALPAQPGDLLNLRDLEQGLENYKRMPTVDAEIKIVPAQGAAAKPGESDVVIGWQEAAMPFRVTLSADDSGSKATGKYQAGVTVSSNNLLTLNDMFYANFSHDLGGGDAGGKGSQSYTLHYDIPYGYWLLGATTSNFRYHQTLATVYQPISFSGNSSSTEIKLSRLLWRDASSKTSAYFSGWSRSSNNFIGDIEIESQHRAMAGWEAGISHRRFIGAATLDASLGYRRGTGAFGAEQSPEEKLGIGQLGSSRPEIVSASAQLNLPFKISKQNLRYNLSWRGQWNDTPLVPQDRLAIGGRYTVRGFDGELYLSGERGWLLRNDLSLALGGSGQEVFTGLDYGQVGGYSTQHLLGTELAGYVVGLRGRYLGMSYELFAGQPLKKPQDFETAHINTGFSLNWTF